MAVGGPVAGFEKHGAEDAELNDFTDDAVDFDPVANADAVAAHQDKPTTEGDDGILEDDGEACGDQADHRGHLLRDAEDGEEDEAEADDLCCEAQDCAERLFLARVVNHFAERKLQPPAGEDRE